MKRIRKAVAILSVASVLVVGGVQASRENPKEVESIKPVARQNHEPVTETVTQQPEAVVETQVPIQAPQVVQEPEPVAPTPKPDSKGVAMLRSKGVNDQDIHCYRKAALWTQPAGRTEEQIPMGIWYGLFSESSVDPQGVCAHLEAMMINSGRPTDGYLPLRD